MGWSHWKGPGFYEMVTEYPEDPSFVPHASLVHFVKYQLARGKTYEQVLKTAKTLAHSYRTNCIDPCTLFNYGEQYGTRYKSDSEHFSNWGYAGYIPLKEVES